MVRPIRGYTLVTLTKYLTILSVGKLAKTPVADYETVASIVYTVHIVDIDNDSRLKMEMMTI